MPIKSGQRWLLKKMGKLGYSKELFKGQCYGITLMARNAFLAGEIDVFQKRLRNIALLNDKDLQAIKYGRFDTQILLESEAGETSITAGDVLAFFDGILMYQDPLLHRHLFGAAAFGHSRRDSDSLLQPVAFDSSMTKGEPCSSPINIVNLSSVYNQEELTTLLTLLESNLSHPVSIHLVSADHAMSLHFNPEKGWLFIDPNHLPGKYYPDKADLAHTIISNFTSNFEEKQVAMAMNFFTNMHHTKAVLDDLNPLFSSEEWQSLTVASPKKLRQNKKMAEQWFFLAIREGQLDVLKDIKTKVPSLTITDYKKALHSAADYGHAHIIKYLLQLGLSINHQDENGSSPLHRAVHLGHLAAIQALLAHGANIKQKEKSGLTPTLIAAKTKNLKIIRILKNAGYNIQWALMEAVILGHLDALIALNQAGAKIYRKDTRAHSPLMIAAEEGHVHILEYLYKSGAELNITTRYGMTLMHAAAKSCNGESLNWLISQGLGYNSTDYSGSTPVHKAVLYKNQEGLNLLLEQKGIHFDTKNREGMTPLMIAAKTNNIEAISILVACGADLSKKNKKGETLLDIAVKHGCLEAIILLTKLGCPKEHLKRYSKNFIASIHDAYVRHYFEAKANGQISEETSAEYLDRTMLEYAQLSASSWGYVGRFIRWVQEENTYKGEAVAAIYQACAQNGNDLLTALDNAPELKICREVQIHIRMAQALARIEKVISRHEMIEKRKTPSVSSALSMIPSQSRKEKRSEDAPVHSKSASPLASKKPKTQITKKDEPEKTCLCPSRPRI